MWRALFSTVPNNKYLWSTFGKLAELRRVLCGAKWGHKVPFSAPQEPILALQGAFLSSLSSYHGMAKNKVPFSDQHKHITLIYYIHIKVQPHTDI